MMSIIGAKSYISCDNELQYKAIFEESFHYLFTLHT